MERWALSGAMTLTGTPDCPFGPPAGFVDGVDRLASSFRGLDGPALLGERAALMGLWRRGAVSCGGSCRLLPHAGGWAAVSLPRQEDRDLVPAWLELASMPPSEPAVWAAVARALAAPDSEPLHERAVLLGLPVARLGEAGGPGVTWRRLGDAPALPSPRGLVVVDLSALWAGPLCGDLLGRSGARVIKVESRGRPDGARRGPAEFFDLLNGGKESVVLDFGDRDDRVRLSQLVTAADVVIEASRPRALEQLGIHAADIVRHNGPKVWLSITAFGRRAEAATRIGFGDDAAVGGGLVTWSDGTPLFCADAVADPLTGLSAAHACLEALRREGRWMLDVSMAAVASELAGPTLPVPSDIVPAAPKARRPLRPAPPFGADTASILARLRPGKRLGLGPDGFPSA